MKAEIQIFEVQYTAALGNLKPLNKLKVSVAGNLDAISNSRIITSRVIKEYQTYYKHSKPNIKIGALNESTTFQMS